MDTNLAQLFGTSPASHKVPGNTRACWLGALLCVLAAAGAWLARDQFGAYWSGVVVALLGSGGCIALVGLHGYREARALAAAQADYVQRLRMLADGLPIGLYVQVGGKVVFANRVFATLTGIGSAQEILGRPSLDFFHPDDHQIVLSRREAIAARGASDPLTGHAQVRLVRSDGTIVFVETDDRPVQWEGKPAIVVAFHDVTRLRTYVEALRESEGRYRTLVDLMPDAVIVSREGKILFINSAGVELFGARSADELIGHPVIETVHPDWRDQIAKRIGRTDSDVGHLRSIQHKRFRLNGGEFWAEGAGAEVIWDGRQARLGVVRDITNRKQGERALQEAKESAELANRTKSEFLANMSHELRTPLNAVIGFSEVMHKELLGPLGNARYRDYARDIFDSGSHLLGVINDILDLSKIEAGKLDIDEDTFDVTEAVEATLRLIKERADQRQIALATRIAGRIPKLRADERKVKQILLNLLSNAVKFTPVGGSVTVSAERCRGGLLIAVTDTGIGIAPEDVPRALEPFRQVSSAHNRTHEGTGLGLPLTKRLVELHGGTLEIASEPGTGTTVSVQFPVERMVA